MKILFVLENHYPNIGGVETLFKSLTESLVNEGFTVTILTNQYDKTLLRKEVLNGVDIIRVPFYNRYLFTLLAFFPAWKLALRHDLIHTTSYNAGLPAFFAGLFSRTKVIITFHEVWGRLWFKLPYIGKISSRFHFLFEQFLVRLPFTHFIAVSEATKKRLQESSVKSNKVTRIYNGIDYSEFDKISINEPIQNKNSKTYTFLYFGRLGISKGLDLLLEAIKLLNEKNNNFRLNLVIPLEPNNFHQLIIKTLKEYGVDDKVDIYSELPYSELQELIQQADAVVIPSYSEGFGFTAVESMALGRPIISSGKGSLAEVVTGKHLTMKEQTGRGLAIALELAMEEKWEEIPLRKFHLQDSIKAYTALYKQLSKSD